ncbi:MAG TPA: hypothetical protein VIE40_08905 [Dehalococcoidia bacterium]
MPGSAIPEPLDPLPLDPALPAMTPGVGHAITPSLEMAQPGATHAGANCGSTVPCPAGGSGAAQMGGGHAGALSGPAASGAYGMGIAHGGTGMPQL